MSAPAQIRADVLRQFPGLFGPKAVNGRTLVVEEVIADLAREAEPAIGAALTARRALLASPEPVARRYAWPAWEARFDDPVTGRAWTYREIVQGLVDNFHGRETPLRWRLNEAVAIPPHLHPNDVAGLELTGPWHPLDMAMNALNSAAPMNMPDFEDASPAHFTTQGSPPDAPVGVYAALQNAMDIFAGRWDGKPYEVPKKGKVRQYRIDRPPARWPGRLARPPSLHLRFPHVTVDGKAAPGLVVVTTLWALCNHDALTRNGSSVAFYVPKLQTPAEAALVERLLAGLEARMGLAAGAIKVKMLYEEGNAGRQLPAIVWALRRRLLGTNVGRWDYLGSLIEMWKDDPAAVFPDPQTIGMATPSMIAYQRWNALLMLMAGMEGGRLRTASPIGGMAAVMIYQANDPYGRARANPIALRAMVLDKLRERLLGLVFVPKAPLPPGTAPTLAELLAGKVAGTLHDEYRQSWVASPEAEYVAAGNRPLQASAGELQALLDAPVATVDVNGRPVPTGASGLAEAERALLRSRGLLDAEGRITPLVLDPASLATPEQLCSAERWEAINAPPRGDVTVEHVQHAFYMAANYGFQILNGNFAAAIDDYELKLRFMNDLATYRINVSWLWTLLRHEALITRAGRVLGPVLTEDGVVLGAPGAEVPAGARFDRALFEAVFQAHDAWTTAFFAEQDRRGDPARFDRSKAPLVMALLRRQLLSPRYVQHSARALFVIGEAAPADREGLLAALFDLDRAEVARREAAGALPQGALSAHDTVHDVVA
jgi:malate synthase